MPDDAARSSPIDALLVACATRGTPSERRAAIAGAVDTIDVAIRRDARATGAPAERYWRDVLARLRHEAKQSHETEVMTCLTQAQALILARAFPKLGPDNLAADR